MKDGKLGFISVNLEDGEWSEERIREWKEYTQEIAEIREKVIQKATEKMKGGKGAAWFMKEAFEFGNFVKENNKDWIRYGAYHDLAMNVTTRYQSPKLDFPEPYNVRDFYARLLGKLEMMEDSK